jgi:hypothetical protein
MKRLYTLLFVGALALAFVALPVDGSEPGHFIPTRTPPLPQSPLSVIAAPPAPYRVFIPFIAKGN